MKLRILIFASLVVWAVSSPVPPKQYRSDYEYNKNTDAFYKLHTEGARLAYASNKCIEEGGELVRITSDEELVQVRAMIDKFPDLQDSVLVGPEANSDDDSEDKYECNVVNRNGEVVKESLFQNRPYVCKVTAEDVPYNEECGVYSNGYESRLSTTGSCYRISTVEANWDEAQANCQAEGAHLVILSNDVELNILFNMLKEKPHNSETQYFAGVRTESTTEPRVYKTVLNQTLEEMGYGPWEEGEPNDYHGDGENCVVLDTRRHGKYNDVACHVRMPYVCEVSKAPPATSTPKSDTKLPDLPDLPKHYRAGYEYNKNTDAFYKLHTEGTTKYYASKKCKAEGAELVKITSDEDLKQVHGMMKKLSDLDDYIMVVSDVDSDEPRLNYECNVVNRRGKIEKTTGRQQLPFVCKVAAKDAPYNEECGVYSNDYESKMSTTGSCYRVSTTEATWNEANANCQAEGAHLVILSNEKELEVLFNMLKEKPHDSETQYFAGVRAVTTTESRFFKTVLNQTLDEVEYGPWEKEEPNDYEGGENCVALDTRRHGKYNDVWCHVRMPYVCESSGAPLEISTTPSTPKSVPTEPLPSKQYRSDYEYNKHTDAFYKVHTERASKNSASVKCIEEGAELAKISSQEDLKQIQAMMNKFPDLKDHVVWVSVEWSSGYQTKSDYNEDNVVDSNGNIETANIFHMLPFVCKVAARDVPYNEKCGVYSNGYESRISTTGSCYRVSTVEATWDEAHANCQAEGAHLVILSNDEELNILFNMLKEKPHNSETQYFAGVRTELNTEPRVFKTVLNQTLEEVGYGPWDEDEPNDYEGGENCVALDTRRHGKYNDVWCHVKMPYVCEKASVVPVPSKQYRPDYEYNKDTDAFYKLHTKGVSKHYASNKCKEEGAELVKITTDEDVKQVHSMMKKLSDLEDYVMVASDGMSVLLNSAGYSPSYECKVVNRKGKIEKTTSRQELPFVCKVAAKNAPYNKECGVYSNDYESRISTTGSCYKVSTVEATWSEAYANCQAEGAHLVILSNDEELKVLYNMLQEKPHNSETQYFAGVRADTTSVPRVFKTVLNQTLEDVGYGPWEQEEPNDYEGGENCVALDTRRNGKYNDVWCHVRMPYVCESSGAPLENNTTPSTTNSVSTLPVLLKQYRPDYEYNKNTDAFYKLHAKGSSEYYAAKKCKTEGAELVKITSAEDLKQIRNMMKKLSDLEDYVLVASDVAPGRYGWSPKCNVVNRRGKAEITTSRQELPFVCKVTAKDAPYNKECGVYSNDYESRISTTGSCYRVVSVEATWNEAHAHCQAEGAHLVILSSDEELEVLYNMLKEKPHNSETQYFAGVRADTTTEPRVFKTILNQTLEEVGYGPWEKEEPNDYEGGENCVALDTRRHGKYNDVWCHVRMPYVCESSGAPLEISATPSKSNSMSAEPISLKQYRPDYEYNKNTDAFYKLHTEGVFKYDASDKCEAEGAELVKITSDEDLKQVHAMLKKLPDLEDYVMVASDVNQYSSNYECNVVNRKGKIEKTTTRQELPFVCKVAAKDAPYSKECGVYSNDYESKISITGSCYKVYTVEATWRDAYAHCQAEGAHLVILSNEKELEVLYNILKDKPHDSETQYFAGVRADTTTEPRVFKTVLNQTLEEVGYGPWDENEPNDYEGGENCVALDMRRHGKYNDVWCHVRMPYVCESPGAPLKISTTPSSPNSVPAVPVPLKKYRTDYEYNQNTDAFYKVHTEGGMYFSAVDDCKKEGAELAQMTSKEDFKQIQAMIKKLPDSKYPFMVGPNSSGTPMYNFDFVDVLTSDGIIEKIEATEMLQFVCKVAAKDAPYNEECGVYSKDYESRISTTGSCYKVYTDEKTWDEAQANCQEEGARLVVLSSEEELKVLYDLLKDQPHDSETQYFAGVRTYSTTEPREFRTVVCNETLEEYGYGRWEEEEPNDYYGGEYCVALDTRRHGKYNDVWCHVKMPYVCESSGAPREICAAPSTPSIESAVLVPSKQYRPDYEYNKNTDSFYKLHTKGTSRYDASDKCRAEGAQLVKITSEEDLKQVYAMMKKLSDLEDLVMIESNEDVGSSKYEGNVVNRRGKIEKTTYRQELPFVCKVAAKDAPYNVECGVYSNDYESRISTTGSCYRVSTVEATWKEAYAKCQDEGAHLVILNNDEELEVLYNMLKDKPHNSETQYFAGVRVDTAAEPRTFKTVLNQTLEEVGYGPWDENEPNDYEGGENCVALDTRRHGKYNDVWCHVRMPYVCESFVDTSTMIDQQLSSISPHDPKPLKPVILPAWPIPYRPDYEYNANVDAFYKLHTEGAHKREATAKCIEEGAELLKVTSEEDLKQVRAMMKRFPNLNDLVIVASIEPYEAWQVDSNYNVLNRNGEIKEASMHQKLPFVCKVATKDVPYNKECDVYSNDYVSRISTTGSCYRVYTAEDDWHEAQANCEAQGAHLVILNSDKELETLYAMLQDKPHNSETQYFAGVRADTTSESRVFKTVLDQTLEEIGYGPWEESEPNDYAGGENCVTLDTRRHGKYNDVWCHFKMPYVCEKTVKEIQSSSKSTDTAKVQRGVALSANVMRTFNFFFGPFSP
ncbi:uncharacterized protein isoform X1 [Choristoneura fumiferana]|uniref:uncharacterized protein isoform X1 n=1 Tax=Choristoneura fumiferana TaxID=7141 RepID=UPI003D157A23